MQINGEAKLLRIFVGESDNFGLVPVYEHIVTEAKKDGLAGATVLKGIMSFGANSRIHTAKILRLSEDLPIVIEIVDESEKIDAFIKKINKLFEEVNCGGLITIEKMNIIKYVSNKRK